ncbi:MAG: S1 RNA-binding domain-containing protein [Chloroflexi bacterium]|nr:S1 RNA-binding domain-containing protein [Chloroflexota bacterium]
MTEETRIVEEGTAADVAAVVEAAEAETAAAPVAEAVAEPLVGMAADTAAEVNGQADAVVDVVAEASATAEEVTESVAERVSGVVADLVEDVTATTEAVVEAVADAAQAVTGKVAEVVEDVAEAVSGAVAEVAGGEDDDDSAEFSSGSSGDRKVVRLSVGQEVKGVIKRITDFGAFVDIGAGRDGLIHISELAIGRVNQVSDVVQAGQEMILWIKKLDRARNRISLTLISPDTKTIKDINDGDVVPGTVSRIVPYGAFIDIGVGTDALLHVREMSSNYVAKPEDVVKLGEKLDVRILAVNRRRRRIDLTLKGVRDEPEPEVAEVAAAAAALGVQENVEIVDPFENVQVLSPMELAFKRAMEVEGVEVDTAAAGKRRGSRSKKSRSMQDEIIRRTLETMRE